MFRSYLGSRSQSVRAYASTTTMPIAIGYIIQSASSFNGAWVYVAIHAFVVRICYLFVVGKIEHMVLK